MSSEKDAAIAEVVKRQGIVGLLNIEITRVLTQAFKDQPQNESYSILLDRLDRLTGIRYNLLATGLSSSVNGTQSDHSIS